MAAKDAAVEMKLMKQIDESETLADTTEVRPPLASDTEQTSFTPVNRIFAAVSTNRYYL